MIDTDYTRPQTSAGKPDFFAILNQEMNSNSNVFIHNLGSSISELYELHVPYAMTYEAIRFEQKTGVFVEVSPSQTSRISFPLPFTPFYKERPLHQHDFFEVMFVLSGTVMQRIEDRCYQYSAGQACLLNRNIRHCEEFSTDFEAVFLMLSDELLCHLLEYDVQYTADGTAHNHHGSIYQLIEKNQRSKYYFAKDYIDFIPVPPFTEDGELMLTLHSLLNQMIAETHGQQPGCILIVEGLFSRFLSILEDSRLFKRESHSLTGSHEELLLNKTGRILEERHGMITRKELETLLNYNGDYVNRIVKKYTGMTLSEYGLVFKLKEAMRLLLNSDKSISAITGELGFTNRNYFYRIFRQRYGMTPGEYRTQKINEQKIDIPAPHPPD